MEDFDGHPAHQSWLRAVRVLEARPLSHQGSVRPSSNHGCCPLCPHPVRRERGRQPTICRPPGKLAKWCPNRRFPGEVPKPADVTNTNRRRAKTQSEAGRGSVQRFATVESTYILPRLKRRSELPIPLRPKPSHLQKQTIEGAELSHDRRHGNVGKLMVQYKINANAHS